MITLSHSLERLEIGGVKINRIVDKKFRTGSVRIRLLTDYTDSDAPALSLLPAILCSGNKSYPTQETLTKRLNELYGGNIWGSCSQISDMLELSFSCDFLLDRYALENEKVALPTVRLLLDCLLDPVITDGAFDETEFLVRRQDLLDSIDSEINERSAYAMTVAYETVYRGESSAKRHYYSREAVQALTPEFCYQAYKRLLENSKIYVSICSGEAHPEIEALLADSLGVYTSDRSLCYYAPSPAKQEPEYEFKYMDVKQASIVLAFKTDSTDYLATKLMCVMYGESPTSVLSLNVREKMSLCYYCQSGFSETKNTMVVVSGVDYKNIPAARKAINALLAKLASGDFSDDELNEAKLYFASRLRSRLDRKGAVIDWYLKEELAGSYMTLDEAIEAVNGISRERVAEAAKRFKLDTVFTLGKEQGNE